MGAFANLKRNAEAIPELLFRSRKSNGQATICFPGPRRPKASDARVRCETTSRSVSDALHYFPEDIYILECTKQKQSPICKHRTFVVI